MQGICNVYFLRCALYSGVQANIVLDENGKCCCIYLSNLEKHGNKERDFMILNFLFVYANKSGVFNILIR